MDQSKSLHRSVNLSGAVMMGLGSIVGTGVFVSLGLAAGLAGSAMVLALFIAGCLAVCNGLSTAQLAASHPVSGGTYEYAYRYIHPWPGFLAGWLFVCAKSASAATAAIGLGAYLSQLLGISAVAPWQIGFGAVVLVTGISLLGIQRSSFINTVIVSVTLLTLAIFVVVLAPEVRASHYLPIFDSPEIGQFSFEKFLEACALLFVAYTGYGRVATLGEEIANPVRNIPKAIVITLGVSFVLYLLVALVAIGASGASEFYGATINEGAPLEVVAALTDHPVVARVLSIGAITAMLGVLLNLVLGVSRVVFAMGRKGDLPKAFSNVASQTRVPYMSVLLTSAVIVLILLLKDIKATWSFSAFTVLVYYALSNISALRLPPKYRLYPRVLAWMGLIGCFGLSLWVEVPALILGGAVLVLGVIWRVGFKKLVG